jgi:beta-glucosidase
MGIYAPAMNIHRSPFSGRNFEYYSEDGTMSGKIGAAVVAGMRSRGMISFIKHYGLNDQETTRYSGLCTWVDEQTMREVYLKPFQLAVEEGKSLGMMSSFNRIGPTPASASYDLMTGINREEWGFRGVIVTDMYGTS